MGKDIGAFDNAVNNILSADETIDMDYPNWIAFAGVRFKRDFGSFKKGEFINGIQIQFDENCLFECDENGERAGREVKLTMTIDPA